MTEIEECPVEGCEKATANMQGHLRLKGQHGDEAHKQEWEERYGNGDNDDVAESNESATENDATESNAGNEEPVTFEEESAEPPAGYRELDPSDDLEKKIMDDTDHTHIKVDEENPLKSDLWPDAGDL